MTFSNTNFFLQEDLRLNLHAQWIPCAESGMYNSFWLCIGWCSSCLYLTLLLSSVIYNYTEIVLIWLSFQSWIVPLVYEKVHLTLCYLTRQVEREKKKSTQEKAFFWIPSSFWLRSHCILVQLIANTPKYVIIHTFFDLKSSSWPVVAHLIMSY